MKNLIIFDFFGVICSEIAPFWLERYFQREEAHEIKAGLIAEADRGEITETQMFETLAEMTGKKAQDVLEEWLELAKIDFQVLRLISSYREQYQVVLLSNAPASFLRRILEREHLETYFDQIMISSEEKMAKPDARIYIGMLDRMGMQPKQALMIDDNPNNLAGAEMVGIYGVLFENAQSFEVEFPKILVRRFAE